MRRLVDDTRGRDRGRHAVGRSHEGDVGATLLDELIAAPFGTGADLVVSLTEAVEELGAGIEAAWALLGEFLPEPVAIETLQLVPFDELDAAGRLLRADGVAPA